MFQRLICALAVSAILICTTATATAATHQATGPALKQVHFKIKKTTRYGSEYAVFVSARCTEKNAYGDWTVRRGNGAYTFLTTGGTTCAKGSLQHTFITTDDHCGRLKIVAKTYDPAHLRRKTIQTFRIKVPARFCVR